MREKGAKPPANWIRHYLRSHRLRDPEHTWRPTAASSPRRKSFFGFVRAGRVRSASVIHVAALCSGSALLCCYKAPWPSPGHGTGGHKIRESVQPKRNVPPLPRLACGINLFARAAGEAGRRRDDPWQPGAQRYACGGACGWLPRGLPRPELQKCSFCCTNSLTEGSRSFAG